MKYLKSINEAVWKRQQPEVEKKVVVDKPNPDIPLLFGDRFSISLFVSDEPRYTNFFHEVYLKGVEFSSTYADPKIKGYLEYYFKKMDKAFLAETLEKLAQDYTATEGRPGTIDKRWLTFSLTKSQTLEFLDLVEKASRGLSI